MKASELRQYAGYDVDGDLCWTIHVETAAEIVTEVELERAQALARNMELTRALQDLWDSYKQGADSGDWGNWSLEEQPQARAAMEVLGIERVKE